MGSSKTLTAVALAYTEHVQNGKKIISNVHLNFPYELFSMQTFMENMATMGKGLDNCVTLLDEAGQYLDARRGGSKANILWTYYTQQTRKRDVDLYACFHHIDVVDKRFRRQIDVRGTCSFTKEEPCIRCGGSGQTTSKPEPCPVCMGEGKVDASGNVIIKGTTPGGLEKGLAERGFKSDSVGMPEEQTNSCTAVAEQPAVVVAEPVVTEYQCPRCKGSGEVCLRCLGFGTTGWGTTKFLDLRTGRRSRVRVFGPAFFGLYSTQELIPMTGKQLRIAVEDL